MIKRIFFAIVGLAIAAFEGCILFPPSGLRAAMMTQPALQDILVLAALLAGMLAIAGASYLLLRDRGERAATWMVLSNAAAYAIVTGVLVAIQTVPGVPRMEPSGTLIAAAMLGFPFTGGVSLIVLACLLRRAKALAPPTSATLAAA